MTADSSDMNEFELISRLFAPLAKSDGAAGLTDDAAVLEPPGSLPVIVTTDALVEGVHFLATDPLDTIAKKLVRVNVSDIIAKGATPFAASLALVWPKDRQIEEIDLFVKGLAEDLEAWSINLVGGDTTTTNGSFTLSMTLHGMCRNVEGPVRRSGAQIGDLIVTTGEIGAGWLGLKAALGDISGPLARQWLQHYHTPLIQGPEAADLVAMRAHASIDISDGLLADLGHICKQSSVGAKVYADRVPLPNGYAATDIQDLMKLFSGGDDYQVLFTCSPTAIEAVAASPVPTTVIGEIVEGGQVHLIGPDGDTLIADKVGWTHF